MFNHHPNQSQMTLAKIPSFHFFHFTLSSKSQLPTPPPFTKNDPKILQMQIHSTIQPNITPPFNKNMINKVIQSNTYSYERKHAYYRWIITEGQVSFGKCPLAMELSAEPTASLTDDINPSVLCRAIIYQLIWVASNVLNDITQNFGYSLPRSIAISANPFSQISLFSSPRN